MWGVGGGVRCSVTSWSYPPSTTDRFKLVLAAWVTGTGALKHMMFCLTWVRSCVLQHVEQGWDATVFI